MTPTEAVNIVILEVGSVKLLAPLLGISNSYLRDIKTAYRKVPVRLVKRLVELSNGKIKASELRPDVF